jgi:serine/threonine protein kinase
MTATTILGVRHRPQPPPHPPMVGLSSSTTSTKNAPMPATVNMNNGGGRSSPSPRGKSRSPRTCSPRNYNSSTKIHPESSGSNKAAASPNNRDPIPSSAAVFSCSASASPNTWIIFASIFLAMTVASLLILSSFDVPSSSSPHWEGMGPSRQSMLRTTTPAAAQDETPPLQQQQSPTVTARRSDDDDGRKPRVVYLDRDRPRMTMTMHSPATPRRKNRTMVDNGLIPSSSSNSVVQDDWQPHHGAADDGEHSECLPRAKWQTQSFPNCNTIHEINMGLSAAEHQHHHAAVLQEEESLKPLGEGWFRTTWQLDVHRGSAGGGGGDRGKSDRGSGGGRGSTESVVLKTLRIAREYLTEYYELHRRDAVAMERLTASPFVVSVYGYCGQSAINELADFPFPNIQNLEAFNRRMRGTAGGSSAKSNGIKLRMAASIALGVADIHAGGSEDDDDETVYMTHYDLNPRNIALFLGGRPKINDFNIAEFLRYDPKTNRTCKFPSRLHEPWWRAPEEMNTTHAVLVDEKVDVYALGNILYHTLTTHSGRGKQKKERMAEVRPIVAAGIRPEIPQLYADSADPSVIAMLKAIDMCWERDPGKRASAEEVAAVLYQALLNITDVLPESAAAAAAKESSPRTDAQDDDASQDVVEDKDALGHAAA